MRIGKILGFRIESDENYCIIRDQDDNIIRHANEYEEKLWIALTASEQQVKDLEKEVNQLKNKNIKERFYLQESYRVQFDWILKNHPEVYNSIPDYDKIPSDLQAEIKRLNQKVKDAYFEGLLEMIGRTGVGFIDETDHSSWNKWAKENNITLI